MTVIHCHLFSVAVSILRCRLKTFTTEVILQFALCVVLHWKKKICKWAGWQLVRAMTIVIRKQTNEKIFMTVSVFWQKLKLLGQHFVVMSNVIISSLWLFLDPSLVPPAFVYHQSPGGWIVGHMLKTAKALSHPFSLPLHSLTHSYSYLSFIDLYTHIIRSNKRNLYYTMSITPCPHGTSLVPRSWLLCVMGKTQSHFCLCTHNVSWFAMQYSQWVVQSPLKANKPMPA